LNPSPTPSPGILVRDARSDDAPAIARFNDALAIETEGKTLEPEVLRAGVAAALADPDRLRYWVAEDATTGQRIGQTAITREWSDWRNGWLWWFQSVYVEAEHRGRGVFRALFHHIKREARAAGDVVGLRLYVERENTRAQRTYESLGMVHGGYEVYEELWPDRFNAEGRSPAHSLD
jgi:GNAT superfamily N-acetyltransferase